MGNKRLSSLVLRVRCTRLTDHLQVCKLWQFAGLLTQYQGGKTSAVTWVVRSDSACAGFLLFVCLYVQKPQPIERSLSQRHTKDRPENQDRAEKKGIIPVESGIIYRKS